MLFFQSFIEYGFNFTATREIAKKGDDYQFCANYFNIIFFSKQFLLLISLVIYVLVIFLFSPFKQHHLLFFSSFLQLTVYSQFPEWFFMGFEKMKIITALNLVVRLLFTVSIFFFIKKPEHSFIIFLLYTFGYLIVNFYSFHYINKLINFRFKFPGFNAVLKNLRYSFNIFMVNFVPMLYNNATTFILGLLSTNYYVGIYDAAKKLIEIGVTVISILSRVFYPFLNRFNDKFSLYKRISLFTGLVFSFFFLILSKFISDIIFGEAFSQSVILIKIMAISVFFVSLYSAFGTNYLMIHKHDKVLMNLTLLVSMIGFILAFPLIIYFNAVGASINLTLSRVILGAGTYLFYIKVKSLR